MENENEESGGPNPGIVGCPEGGGPEGWRGPKISRCFPSPVSHFVLSSLSGFFFFRGVVVAVQGHAHPTSAFRLLWGHLVRAPEAQKTARILGRSGGGPARPGPAQAGPAERGPAEGSSGTLLPQKKMKSENKIEKLNSFFEKKNAVRVRLIMSKLISTNSRKRDVKISHLVSNRDVPSQPQPGHHIRP